MTIHTPAAATELPEWSLTDLYDGRDDPRVEQDLQAARAANAALAELKGKLVVARADPQRLGALLAHAAELYEAATNKLWSLGAYAGLMTSTCREDAAWSKFEGDMRAQSSTIAAEALFLTLELNQLDEAEIETALRADPAAAHWRPWLRRVRLMRAHELSDEMERLLNDRAPAVANWSRLYDETLSRMVVKVGRESLTLPEALNRLSDADPAQRKTAAQGLAKALEQATPTLALSLNTIAFEKQVEDRWRRFADPAA
ncbi:MAG TPA: oligoendopeptidase F, partial [Caulobacteraceae bacterium]|nr:oligoendopeptidase F [Caulobacteraceae bacterium]